MISKKVLSVCVSPDGRKIISGSSDNTVRIWDGETGIQITSLIGHQSEVCFLKIRFFFLKKKKKKELI